MQASRYLETACEIEQRGRKGKGDEREGGGEGSNVKETRECKRIRRDSETPRQDKIANRLVRLYSNVDEKMFTFLK